MIEFKGHITGAAEKGFLRKTRNTGLVGYCIVLPLILPMPFFIAFFLFHDMNFFYMMGACLLLIPAFFFIPKRKKEHLAMLPKRIYTDGETIVCVADRYTDSKFVDDVKKVLDHGEYYELCFPFGKLSDKFICQKSLLTRGSINEFERLFKGRIVRKLTSRKTP